MEDTLLHDEEKVPRSDSFRKRVYDFLECKTSAGSRYEAFTIALILLNVVCFALGTYNENGPDGLRCKVCLTSSRWTRVFDIIEIVTCSLFTVEYAARFFSIVEENDGSTYRGLPGRLRWAITDFYSIVDLFTIVPFYVDLCTPGDLASSQFLRVMRLFRMMRVESRYLETFDVFDSIFRDNAGLWQTAGFVGFTTWMIVSSLYYATDKDTVNGDTGKKCFQSIPEASYFALLNLFGEFPLIDTHSNYGRVVGVFVAVVAVVVFSIPAGIM